MHGILHPRINSVGTLPGLPEHGSIMRRRRREHIVEIAERDYGIPREDRAAIASANSAYGEPPRSSEPSTDCNGSCLSAGIDAELDEEVGDVGLHGAGTNEERLADLPVGVTFNQ